MEQVPFYICVTCRKPAERLYGRVWDGYAVCSRACSEAWESKSWDEKAAIVESLRHNGRSNEG